MPKKQLTKSNKTRKNGKKKNNVTKKVNVMKPGETGLVQQVSKIGNQREVVNAAQMAMDQFSGLSPLSQHNLSMMRPGVLNTPFVEDNSEVCLIPTTINHGQFQLNTTSTAAAQYSVITCCPIFGLSASVISTGVGYEDGLMGTATLSNLNLQGLGYSQVYGSTTFCSKILSYATRLEVTFMAPEATLTGSVYLGELPYSSFYGSSVVTLIDNARTTIDLKTKSVFEMKSTIRNRNLIHRDPAAPIYLFKEEMVAYAVISQSPAIALDGSTLVPYSVSLKMHSNTLWWPVNSTPILNGIAVRSSYSVAPSTPKQEIFNNQASSGNSSTVASLSNIIGYAKKLLSVASEMPVIGTYARPASALVSAISNFAVDPLSSLPQVDSIISDFEWFLTCASARWPKIDNEEVESIINDWFIKTNVAIKELSKFKFAVQQIREASKKYNKQIVFERGGSRYAYFDNQGKEVAVDLGVFAPKRSKSIDTSVCSEFGFKPR